MLLYRRKFLKETAFSCGTYVVTNFKDKNGEPEWKCTCPDFMSNGHICKHILAVQQKLDTQSTKWTDYNLYQTTEGTTFTSYLKELVSFLDADADSQTGRGRPYAPLSKEVFCAVMKAYTNQSTRRVQSVINRAEDDNLCSPLQYRNTFLKQRGCNVGSSRTCSVSCGTACTETQVCCGFFGFSNITVWRIM